MKGDICMRSIESLLSAARQKGVQLWTENGSLHYRVPVGHLADQELGEIRLRKAEAIEFLTQAPFALEIQHCESQNARPPALALAPRPRPKVIPLSFSQERLWLLDRLDMGSAYVIPVALELRGDLDVGALTLSFSEVVRRHESLRTHFEVIDDQPSQVIEPSSTFHLELQDLSACGQQALPAEIQRIAREEIRRPFNLSRGPVFRARLLHLAAELHVLLLTMHHIVSDEWSIGILMRELQTFYTAFSRGLPPPLAELPVQYADYSLWQRDLASEQALAEQLQYWRKQLADAPARLELPTDRPRPSVASLKGDIVSFTVPKALSASLLGFSRAQQVTPFMMMLAAYQLLLSHYSRQDDIAVGVPASGRTHKQTENLIGFFVNTLVMRANLSGSPTFREFLSWVRNTAVDAFSYQDIPFERLVIELKPGRDLSSHPLFQSMFVMQNSSADDWSVPGVQFAPANVDLATSTAKFDLTLYMREVSGSLHGTFEYATDIFFRSTIERFAEHFIQLLRSIVSHPDARVATLDILPQQEKSRLLFAWNETKSPYPEEVCVHELFVEQAAKTPDAVALLSLTSRLTFRELDERSNQLGHHLRSLGVGAEAVVGLCAERSIETLIGLLAILKAGAAYLALDPSYPPARLSYMINDSSVSTLLVQDRWLGHLPSHQAKQVLLAVDWPIIARNPVTPPEVTVNSSNLAYLTYTSGSTGRPKAVAAVHRAVVNRLWVQNHIMPFDVGGVGCQKTPVGFVDSITEIFAPLLAGCPLVIAPTQVGRDIEELLMLLERTKVSHLVSVPSLARALVQQPGASLRLQALSNWTLSGEVLPMELHRQLSESLPHCRFVNVYGASEVGADATYYECGERDAVTMPIGRPIANIQAYVLDNHFQPVPTGVAGELFIAGDGLARGYLNNTGLTAKRFLPNPFDSPGSRMYRTGDIARWLPDGNLEFVGRIDYQIKIRGMRVEPAEIEAILQSHPKVLEAAVIARHRTSEDQRLICYIRAKRDRMPTADELRQHLRQIVPEHMLPATFVVAHAFPRNSSGKLDRHALQELDVETLSEEQFVAPSTPIEERLVQIWRELLNVERIGIRDNFFDIGGHSLLTTRLLSQIREVFGVEMRLRVIFEVPTIEQLAARIGNDRPEGPSPLHAPLAARHPRPKRIPLSFAQEIVWLRWTNRARVAIRNLVGSWSLEGSIDATALEYSFCELARRHEILRTRFGTEAGAAYQMVEAPPSAFPIHKRDLSALSLSERDLEIRQFIHAETERTCSLTDGGLFQASLLKCTSVRHMLLVAAHPIIADSWSMNLIGRELGLFYALFQEGPAPKTVSGLPIQYADYSLWQRRAISGAVLDQARKYWADYTSRLTSPPGLIASRKLVSGEVLATTSPLQVSADLGVRLLASARTERTSPYLICLTAFELLLSIWSGKREITVLSPVTGREQSQTQQMIGAFSKPLRVRLPQSHCATFSELLNLATLDASEARRSQILPLENFTGRKAPLAVRDAREDAIFVWENIIRTQEWLKITVSPVIDICRAISGGELTLRMCNMPDGSISGAFEYDPAQFSANTVAELARHYLLLLERVSSNLSIGIEDLALFDRIPTVMREANKFTPQE